MKGFKNSLIYLLLYLLPKNLVSNLMGRLVSIKMPPKMALWVNKGFARCFNVNVGEAALPIGEYACLQDFFVRRLKAGVRPVHGDENSIVSPCDGFLSEFGEVRDGWIRQIKGRDYRLKDLLASQALAQRFMKGHFATIYLSPKDYHRFHVPLDGEITETIHVPGTLWPVNKWAVRNISNLFCINERMITLLRSHKNAKHLAHIAVGATMVGKVKLAYCSLETNANQAQGQIDHKNNGLIQVKRGDDLGEFMFGSTIVMLFEAGMITGMQRATPGVVKVGEVIAKIN